MDFDSIVIGSGFGGIGFGVPAGAGGRPRRRARARAALGQGQLSARSGDWVWDQNDPVSCNGWLDIRIFQHMAVVQGAAVGGGSLIYAKCSVDPAGPHLRARAGRPRDQLGGGARAPLPDGRPGHERAEDTRRAMDAPHQADEGGRRQRPAPATASSRSTSPFRSIRTGITTFPTPSTRSTAATSSMPMAPRRGPASTSAIATSAATSTPRTRSTAIISKSPRTTAPTCARSTWCG